ncbi:nucleotide exchange factor SIL1 [Thamnophis elegans]|uniref:nucleotide exchange factor SIL1 n=1 Tax=Thamnophis elegans TaxID=35005 RepID=UPI0013789086|nr:nucleotide exchange factor SIL1 [Thamnophis elegans]XP_032069856.1 nucleotide exchange factor SIL1 [Thamnophis elegans]XP_032069857.1 nucleotide exchange factor SIL1 [Thamnophis elegans]XP_032069858.1 nucleotide exchange factor SIL1 [Thamnophis elegans]XP_032069859.1 nucleotide exchange factor SIL1 [Thamnophis elegans]XP_032069860.1 nucleotide exchange factor SIL1 [Thamnophis elegans]
MPHICFWSSIVTKLNLVVLLLFITSFSSCLNDRVTEFALTKKEEGDLKEQNKEELEVIEVEEEVLDSEDLEVFYPTNQWQTVRPGQAIPAGLHVQLNLQTGEKLAKLPDDYKEKSDTKDSPKNKRLGQIDIDPNSFTTQELKRALAKMKETTKADDTPEEKAHREDIRRRFRSIEKLKEEFRELNLQMETDLEIMLKLINKFNNSASTLEEKITALSDLEYYVHQVDNARDLLSLGGLQLLINGLNSSEPLMKEYASFVLGAALSSNPRVQVAAIQGGALQKLLVILATDQSFTVKKKALFALSSMLRHFPYAQQQFLKLGGLQVLRNLCTEKGMEILYIRTVTLLYDLVVEKQLLSDEEEAAYEKSQQYSQVNLMPAIVEQGWCTIISNLLRTPEHDSREKVLKTVHVVLASCKDTYAGDPALSHVLGLLRQEYEELAEEERKEGDEDGYFKELLHSINSIAQQLK